jgi:hypothetical protein
MDYTAGQESSTSTFCLTVSPPKSVTLDTSGSLVECAGDQCLANAGVGTPTLQYGTSIHLGPFDCASSASGITCTIANGSGFLISSSAITPLGKVTVTQKSGQ